MGQIVLGIGTSHSPMLNATAEEWALFAPREPTLRLLGRDGEPTSYQALLAEAAGRYDGECTPARFTERLRAADAALDRLRDEIGRARLDALVIVGDDQKELFLDDNLPGLLVYRGRTVPLCMRPAKPEWVDWFAVIQSRYYVEAGRVECPADDRLARHLIEHLAATDFDVAVSDRLPRDEGEGHAFAFVHRRLLGVDTRLPVVPVFLNTYYPPNQPAPGRCYAIGRAIRAAIETYPSPIRVGVSASGGLSHFAIDEPFDRAIVQAFRDKDGDALKALPREKLNSGSSEIRNWVAAAGALEHLPLAWADYIPAYRSPAGTGTGLCFAAWRA
ncbi:MAG TPA: protocatechuate 3,4-dioxygenase [Burkholderiales bacterium]|nr:protocatechuate 3,4-dioxygenase [Burkholderiales bacterium]